MRLDNEGCLLYWMMCGYGTGPHAPFPHIVKYDKSPSFRCGPVSDLSNCVVDFWQLRLIRLLHEGCLLCWMAFGIEVLSNASLPNVVKYDKSPPFFVDQ